MVDAALFERVMDLDVPARREFVRAVESTFDEEGVPPAVLAEIDRRLGEMGEAVSPESISVDEDEFLVRSRRDAA